MSPLDPTLAYLYGLQRRGIKFGLRNTRILLRALGNPQTAFRSVHIAGTNGKGSTSAYLASIMREAGFRTGLYTSPHLVRFTERIRVDGREIPDGVVVRIVDDLRPLIEETQATFFEVVTSLAFRYFADRTVEIAIVETGLGGRLDATNVLSPMVSVITNIGMDHREILGGTLRSIAREKGGIIKAAVPCVIGSASPDIMKVFRGIAARKQTRVVTAPSLVSVTDGSGPPGATVTIRTGAWTLRSIRPGLSGLYQHENIASAVAAGLLVARAAGCRRRPGRDAIRRGIVRIRSNTGLRGRLERVGKRYLLDVAHNPDGARALVKSLEHRSIRNLPVVFGVLKDKEHRPMLRALASVARPLITVSPATPRAMTEAALRRSARSLGLMVRKGGSVQKGIGLARRLAGLKRPLLITGSHFVVGEALLALRRNGP